MNQPKVSPAVAALAPATWKSDACCHATTHRIKGPAGHRCMHLNWPSCLHNAEEGGHGLQVKVWRLPSQQLNAEAAYAPDVSCSSHAGHLNDFRRHPVGRSHHALPQALIAFRTASKLGRHAKISQLHHALQGKRQRSVPRLHVELTLRQRKGSRVWYAQFSGVGLWCTSLPVNMLAPFMSLCTTPCS